MVCIIDCFMNRMFALGCIPYSPYNIEHYNCRINVWKTKIVWDVTIYCFYQLTGRINGIRILLQLRVGSQHGFCLYSKCTSVSKILVEY